MVSPFEDFESNLAGEEGKAPEAKATWFKRLKKGITTPSSEKKETKTEKSRIGRNGAGALGQNWVESHRVAEKGRYDEENKVQGTDPEETIDTDVSQAA